MKRKLLTLLLLSALSISLVGCQKKIVYTGDEEIDKEIQEMWEEEFEDENYNDEDYVDETDIDIKETYIVNIENKDHALIFFESVDVFNSFTKLVFVGINNGTKKIIKDDSIMYSLVSPARTIGGNILNIPVLANKKCKLVKIPLDCDEYEKYELRIETYKGMVGVPNILLDEESYYLDSKDLVRVSIDELINQKKAEIFKKVKSKNSFQYKDLNIEYISGEYSVNSHNVQVKVTNTGNVPSDFCNLELAMLTSDDDYYTLPNKGGILEIPKINPGESQIFTIEYSAEELHEWLYEMSGKEYILEFMIRCGDEREYFYLKSKF